MSALKPKLPAHVSPLVLAASVFVVSVIGIMVGLFLLRKDTLDVVYFSTKNGEVLEFIVLECQDSTCASFPLDKAKIEVSSKTQFLDVSGIENIIAASLVPSKGGMFFPPYLSDDNLDLQGFTSGEYILTLQTDSKTLGTLLEITD